MKPITSSQRQWLWFVALWFAGLMSVSVLAYGMRWLLRIV
ncbi:MAG: DUF2474 domain-containing protein [Desulfatitalea sp.]|nr:DUF2474 domain-containing protein [Desulfatitalea sp.]